MSATTDAVKRVTTSDIGRMFADGERIPMLTAYDYPGRVREEALVGVRVAARGCVQALAAGERLVSASPVLPGAVVREGAPFEVADADVVEVRVDHRRNVVRARGESKTRGLLCARKGGDGAPVDRDRGDLSGEGKSLLDPERSETSIPRRVAVDDPVDVEQRLPVPDQEKQPHAATVPRLRCLGGTSFARLNLVRS